MRYLSTLNFKIVIENSFQLKMAFIATCTSGQNVTLLGTCPFCGSFDEQCVTKNGSLMRDYGNMCSMEQSQEKAPDAHAESQGQGICSGKCALAQIGQQGKQNYVELLVKNGSYCVMCYPDTWHAFWNSSHILQEGSTHVLTGLSSPSFPLVFICHAHLPFLPSLRFCRAAHLSIFKEAPSGEAIDPPVAEDFVAKGQNAQDIQTSCPFTDCSAYTSACLNNDSASCVDTGRVLNHGLGGEFMEGLRTIERSLPLSLPRNSTTNQLPENSLLGAVGKTVKTFKHCRRSTSRTLGSQSPNDAESARPPSKPQPVHQATPSPSASPSLSACFMLSLLIFLTPTASAQRAGSSERVDLRLCAIIPRHLGMRTVLIKEFTHTQIMFVRGSGRLRYYNGRFNPKVDPREDIKFVHSDSPKEILNMFCKNILGRNVVTILNINNPMSMQRRSTANNYILEMASYLGIPIISWDTQFTSSSEVSTYLSELCTSNRMFLFNPSRSHSFQF